jgi:hypothetical protein
MPKVPKIVVSLRSVFQIYAKKPNSQLVNLSAYLAFLFK